MFVALGSGRLTATRRSHDGHARHVAPTTLTAGTLSSVIVKCLTDERCAPRFELSGRADREFRAHA